MRRQDSCSEYLLAFATFYKSMCAKDKLRSHGITAVLQRMPAGVFKTCSQGLHVSHCDIDEVRMILHDIQAEPRQIYEMSFRDGIKEYRKL